MATAQSPTSLGAPEGWLEAALKRDRAIVIAGLIAMTALAWAYTTREAWDMRCIVDWRNADLFALFLMWTIMMVAMMTPSAAPMILIFAAASRKRRAEARPYVPTAVFLLGYLLVWAGFSFAATLAQWALHAAALLSPMMVSNSPRFGGLLLIGAGVFQFMPFKHTCLSHCRSPLSFLLAHWRGGARGALAMGIHHGAYCTGCCWALMALLFVAGVMNLLWVATLSALVLLEKSAPRGDWVARVAGVVLCAAGVVLLTRRVI